jgi:hypothetical protein
LEDVKGVKRSMREFRRLAPPALELLSRGPLSTVGVREWLGVLVKEFEFDPTAPAPAAPVTDTAEEEEEEDEEERKRSRRDWMRRLEEEEEGWRGKDSMLETRTTCWWGWCGRVCGFVWW